MAETPTLIANIKLRVEKSFLVQQINSISQNVQNSMSTNMIKRSVNNLKNNFSGVGAKEKSDSSSTSDEGYGLGMLASGLKTIVSSVKKFSSGFLKIIGVISLVEMFIGVLKPVASSVSGIMKMLGEFLRPISDVIYFLLQPILVMLRPILFVFKTLMAPFKEIAMRGLMAANLLISRGMKVGGATGGEMVAEGYSTALSSASLMLSGFIEVAFSPVVDFFNSLGGIFGDSSEKWDNLMMSWQNSALQGIARGEMFSTAVISLWDTFLVDSEVGWTATKNIVDKTFRDMQLIMNNLSISNYKDVMIGEGGIIDITQKSANVLNNIFTGDEDSVKKAFGDLATSIENSKLAINLGAVVSNINNTALPFIGFNTAIKNTGDVLKEQAKNLGMALEDLALGSLVDLKSQFEVDKPKDLSGWDKFWLGFEGLGNSATGIIGGINQGIGSVISAFYDIEQSADLSSQSYKNFEDVFSGRTFNAPLENAKKNLVLATNSWEDSSLTLVENWKKQFADLDSATLTSMLHTTGILEMFLSKSIIPDQFLFGMIHIYQITNMFFNAINGIIPMLINSGMKSINREVDNKFNPFFGTVVVNTKNGLDVIGKAVTEWAKSCKNVSYEIIEIAKETSRQAQIARNAANNAKSAANQIISVRSSLLG
jgi:hypothetical protein